VLALSYCAEPDDLVLRESGRTAPSGSDSFWERLASLTPRQRRALDLLLTGQPNKVIAYELGVAETTVKAHVGAVMRKLKVRNRAQVIAVATRLERFEDVALQNRLRAGRVDPKERVGADSAAAKLVGGLR